MKPTAAVLRRFRNLRRVQQIVSAFARHGFGDVVSRLRLGSLVPATLRASRSEDDEAARAAARLSVGERFRLICETLGPTFIKLGQVMATRPDLVPPQIVLELSKLHDEVPPFPTVDLMKVIEADLGPAAGTLLADVEERPLAAASIAQVHGATLSDGRRVVVKVQRPNLQQIIDTDLDILRGLAELLEEYVEEARTLRPRAIVEEFAHSLAQEIDFRREADNMERFRRQFAESPLVVVPRSVPELCSARVITMERMEGFKLTDRAQVAASGLDPMKIARDGTQVMLQSIFEHGFFHADPHPGNFLVRPDGVLVLLDFGLMGELEPRRVDELLGFIIAVLLNDPDMLLSQLQEMEILDQAREPRRLREELSRLLNKFQSVRLADMDAAEVIARVIDVIRKEDVSFPTDLLLVMKSVATVEGIATAVCPDFQPVEEIRPYLVTLYTKRVLDPRQQSRMVARTLADVVTLLRTMPRDLRSVLRRLNRGDLRIETRSAEGDADRAQRDRAMNRLLLTLVLCTSMVLSAALLYYPPGDPAVASTPWGAYGGLLFSFVLLVTLLWSIFRSRGL